MFEFLKVVIKIVVGRQNGKKKNKGKCFLHFSQGQMEIWSISTWYTVE